mmetsp:Transcript_13900/g.28716  ORF Transcript_13900/g.28716 Transcript_13900/m.28716 type:complete len:285 (-) Transcript_13900:875-1729(-)
MADTRGPIKRGIRIKYHLQLSLILLTMTIHLTQLFHTAIVGNRLQDGHRITGSPKIGSVPRQQGGENNGTLRHNLNMILNVIASRGFQSQIQPIGINGRDSWRGLDTPSRGQEQPRVIAQDGRGVVIGRTHLLVITIDSGSLGVRQIHARILRHDIVSGRSRAGRKKCGPKRRLLGDLFRGGHFAQWHLLGSHCLLAGMTRFCWVSGRARNSAARRCGCGPIQAGLQIRQGNPHAADIVSNLTREVLLPLRQTRLLVLLLLRPQIPHVAGAGILMGGGRMLGCQ